MMINKERVWQRIQELGRIGCSDEGGLSRYAYTLEDSTATNLVIEWMKQAGMKTRSDEIGNVFGRLDGEADAPVILTGSHLDTVCNGGMFDGTAGVIAALEVLEVIKERNIKHRHPVEMVIFKNEEGSWFPGGLMGSLAVTGSLEEDFAFGVQDKDGITLAQSMEENDLQPDKIMDAKRDDIKLFIELHIEQAKVLENQDIPVGIVTGIAGAYQMNLNILGRSGHAGAVPMAEREDPLVAAGMIIQEVEKSAIEEGKTLRGTVGYISSKPGGHNVISSEVEMTLDYRDIDMNARERAVCRIKNYIDEVCKNRNLRNHLIVTQDAPAIEVDQDIIELLQNCANELSIPTLNMPSGAAHDAMIMSKICKIGMIFVRSKNGLSHCPEEYSSQDDIALGTELMFHSIVKSANPEF